MKRLFLVLPVLMATLSMVNEFCVAQALTIKDGATLSLNANTLNVNCRNILIESGGTLNVGDGTLLNAGTITVETGGVLLAEGSGTIRACVDISVSVTATGAAVPSNGWYVIHRLAAGTSQQVQFTITNSGTATVDLLGSPNVVIGGNHPGDLRVVSYPTSPIASGGSTDFTLEFTAGSDDTRDATVTIEAGDGLNQLTYTFIMVANPRYLLWTR